MATDEFRSGMGSIGFWGNTPATDLLELMKSFEEPASEKWSAWNAKPEINILLLGQADCRHILKTIASNCKTDSNLDTKFHINVVESHPVLYARQLLLLHLTFLPREKIGLYEKVKSFMDIIGNVLIRPQTRKIIRTCCEDLIKVVTDDKVREAILPIVHLEELKHRERDMIVEVLQYWVDSSMSATEMQDLWDQRVRHCLSSRYDSRMGVFDWDYQMRMVEKNSETKIVHVREYKNWRNTGLAFNEYENDYNQANVTLLSGNRQPYHGDILIGPFIPFGIKCDDESFFEKVNHEFKKKSQDLTFHTLQDIFRTITSQCCMKFRVSFLPFDTSENLWKKTKFGEKFDLVLASNFICHQIKPELMKLMGENGVVVVDKTRYIWYFRPENDAAFESKLLELAHVAVLEQISLLGDYKNDFYAFVPKKIGPDGDSNENAKLQP